nr:MFS transporter [Xylella taiwanensis]
MSSCVLLSFRFSGHWTMAAALTMRRVQPADIPEACAIAFGGISVAMVVAALMSSLIEPLIGWRGVFLIFTAIGVLCLAWPTLILPAMPFDDTGHVKAVFAVLHRRGVPVTMLAIAAVCAGQIAIFTSIRALLETHACFDVTGILSMLLVFGTTNFIETSLAATTLKTGLHLSLAAAPLVIGACAPGMPAVGTRNDTAAMTLIALWSLAFGCIPVTWSTWITHHLGDDAENAGGLQVTTLQLANTFRAAVGRMAFVIFGMKGPVLLGAALLLVTYLISMWYGTRCKNGCLSC